MIVKVNTRIVWQAAILLVVSAPIFLASPAWAQDVTAPVKHPLILAAVLRKPISNDKKQPAHKDHAKAQANLIVVRGFHVVGVHNHPKEGITPARIQRLTDQLYAKLGGTASKPARVTFAQLQGVANAITNRYRKAGFIVATAFLPAQTIGKNRIVTIRVLEGRVGRVVVIGAKRYYPWVLAASARQLKGKALQKSSVDSALLYDRDFPGVSVEATLVPGAKLGQTNVLLIAHDAPRPYSISLGVNNYGTSLTGLYHVLLGAAWNNPLGLGDRLVARVDYGLDPSQSLYGSLFYKVPIVMVSGASAVVGVTRSTLQINNGQFAALHISGPTLSYYGGFNWKFINDENLKTQTSLQFINENATITSLGETLSNEQFDVVDLGFDVNQIDRRFRGVDLLQFNLRQSVSGHSQKPDLVSPDHANIFTIEQVMLERLQFLPYSQRLYVKFVGQYTRDVLPPLEQFSIGGPGSVRAYPLDGALTDSGYYASLKYRIPVPGLSRARSPFSGERWRSVLGLETFLEYARGYPSSGDQLNNQVITAKGVGVGLVFHWARFHNLQFHLNCSVPIGATSAFPVGNYQIWSALSLQY